MRIKAAFYVIYETNPEDYPQEVPRTAQDLAAYDYEQGAFNLEDGSDELILVDAVEYNDDDDNIEGRHEVRMQAIELGREL